MVALLVFGALWVGGVIGDDPVPKDPVAAEHDWRTVPTIETTPDMSIKPGFRMGSTTKNILNRVDSLPAAEACSIPRFVNTDQVAAERTVRAMVDCAARSWRPVLDRILEPRFIQDVDQVWTITEPKPYEFTCTMVALQDKSFYCPGEETGITIRADQQASVGDLLTTVTHEYGHHIQELAGIASGLLPKPVASTRAKRETNATPNSGEPTAKSCIPPTSASFGDDWNRKPIASLASRSALSRHSSSRTHWHGCRPAQRTRRRKTIPTQRTLGSGSSLASTQSLSPTATPGWPRSNRSSSGHEKGPDAFGRLSAIGATQLQPYGTLRGQGFEPGGHGTQPIQPHQRRAWRTYSESCVTCTTAVVG
ncbi:hypothetical protein GS894_23590 [Rhodococcus hoagii]|nr:hypothetical protein [Prescottella equi]